uniref:Uncharacterized protein n=1 Tax=Brassica oleracea var. oleracea TaxID=109376 RepID=A0A0D3ARA2_BRAOL
MVPSSTHLKQTWEDLWEVFGKSSRKTSCALYFRRFLRRLPINLSVLVFNHMVLIFHLD